MGLWAGIKAVGTFLTGGTGGSESNGMTVVKGIGNWIDEQKFTEQEKAEYSVERAKIYGNFLAQTVEENSERSRTRRALALLIIRWWLMMLTFCAIVWLFNPTWAEFIFKIATFSGVAWLVGGIGAFFFGAHIVRAYKK